MNLGPISSFSFQNKYHPSKGCLTSNVECTQREICWSTQKWRESSQPRVAYSPFIYRHVLNTLLFICLPGSAPRCGTLAYSIVHEQVRLLRPVIDLSNLSSLCNYFPNAFPSAIPISNLILRARDSLQLGISVPRKRSNLNCGLNSLV